MGAEELLAVDVDGVGITRPNLTGLPTTYVRSHWELGSILVFQPETAKRNMALGYQDCHRAFGKVLGLPTPCGPARKRRWPWGLPGPMRGC